MSMRKDCEGIPGNQSDGDRHEPPKWVFRNLPPEIIQNGMAIVPDLVTGKLLSRKRAGLRLLAIDYETNLPTLKKVERCSHETGTGFPCNSPYCPYCSVPARNPRPVSRGEERKLDPNIINYTGPRYGSWSRNPRIRAGQQAAFHFDGLPLRAVGAVTVMLGITRKVTDERQIRHDFAECKKRLAKALSALDPRRGDKAYFRLEFAMKRVDELRVDPAELGAGRLQESDEVVALIHAHGLVHLPNRNIDQLRNFLKTLFPGRNQLNVEQPKPDRITESGHRTGGAQGFMEYAGKRTTGKHWLSPEKIGAYGQQRYHQTVLIKFLAEAEIYRALKGFRMTVTRGIRKNPRASQGSDRKDSLMNSVNGVRQGINPFKRSPGHCMFPYGNHLLQYGASRLVSEQSFPSLTQYFDLQLFLYGRFWISPSVQWFLGSLSPFLNKSHNLDVIQSNPESLGRHGSDQFRFYSRFVPFKMNLGRNPGSLNSNSAIIGCSICSPMNMFLRVMPGFMGCYNNLTS